MLPSSTAPSGPYPREPVNARLEREARRRMDDAVAAADDVHAEGEFRVGRPVDVLVECSRELDLLMAGSRRSADADT